MVYFLCLIIIIYLFICLFVYFYCGLYGYIALLQSNAMSVYLSEPLSAGMAFLALCSITIQCS